MTCGIYKITNKINNKCYIGRSVNIEHRWIAHKSESILDYNPQYNYVIHQAFRKYGLDNFNFEIIEEIEESKLDEREKYWIKYYNSYNKGYNSTEGGDIISPQKGEQNNNSKLTEQDVYYIRTLLLEGKMLSEVYPMFQEKISRRGFEHVWRGENWKEVLPEAIEYLKTKEYKKSIKKYGGLTAHKDTELFRKDIAERKNKGESRDSVYNNYKDKYTLNGFYSLWYSLPITNNNHKKKTRKVQKLDKDTLKPLEIYESGAEAGRQNNCDPSSILKVCRGQKNSCGGFKWRYYNEDIC